MVPCRRLFFLTSFAVLIGFAKGQDMAWKTAFSLTGEKELAKDNLLTTLPTLTKEWRVSLEVKPTDYDYGSYANVLHMTIGGKGLGAFGRLGRISPPQSSVIGGRMHSEEEGEEALLTRL